MANMRTSLVLGLLGALLHQTQAVPTPTVKEVELEARQNNPLGLVVANIENLLNETVTNPPTNNLFGRIEDSLKAVTSTAVPVSLPAAFNDLQNILVGGAKPSNIYGYVASLVSAGLSKDNIPDLLNFVKGVGSSAQANGENSFNNVNPIQPATNIYPKADPRDAPYSLSEESLRAAIHIPSSFQYGRSGAPNPIILTPGTGATGYLTFIGNMIPLLQGSSIADPVWLNIPGYLLGDVQQNAEYVAYAVNYISGISGNRNVSVAGWSQGSIDGQWAWKYWPSARRLVTDFITFSGDFAGSIFGTFLATPGIPLPPAYVQQAAGSNFINTLRSNGGDSAYVPTTSIYSSFFDEIVQPQTGTAASAFIRDARNVGVSNTEVQQVCSGAPAGSFYTHEGVMYNPLSFALLQDALAHPGPGQVSRIPNLQQLCENFLAPGLGLTDFLLTENAIVAAVLTTVTYPQKVTVEPPIKAYAQ